MLSAFKKSNNNIKYRALLKKSNLKLTMKRTRPVNHVILYTISAVFGFALIYFRFHSSDVIKPIPSSVPDPVKHKIIHIPSLCKETHHIQQIRERRNSSSMNPAQYVVEELLGILKFDLTKSVPLACINKKSGERLAVIIVNTGRDHFNERLLIRQTWGSLNDYKEWKIITRFLVGQSDYCLNDIPANYTSDQNYINAEWEEKTLIVESKIYGDILTGAFTDTYRNLTYKHLMGYKFVIEHCPEADIIIKTDDDMFVGVPAVLDFKSREFHRKSENSSYIPYDIYCDHFHDAPTRCQNCPNGKWFSTWEEWPEDGYPPYCLGNDYVITNEWMQKIYSARGEGGFFWVDDVFIMGKLRDIAETREGKLANELNIRAKGYVNDPRGNSILVLDNCLLDNDKFSMFVFNSRNRREFQLEMHCLWRRALRIANVSLDF